MWKIHKIVYNIDIMKRLIERKIYGWSNDKNSLPLFIIGARQIGKTYSVLNFANNYFKDKFIYINFMNKDRYFNELNGKTNPKEIINILKNTSKLDIQEDWLIIFDEIQEISGIKTSLKLFVEQNLKYKIICLGSYLGNMLNDKDSFPVGKIQYFEMFPMNFEEFLMADEKYELIEIIKHSIENNLPISDQYHKQLMNLLHEFMIIGGMPRAVQNYITDKDNLLTVNNIKDEILNSYLQDIVKYIEYTPYKLKAQNIYNNIPTFLAKENKKYMLSKIDKNARYRDYDLAIYSLLTTKIIYKVNNLNSFTSPIIVNRLESEFKIYYNDCGFLSHIFQLNINNLQTNNRLKGAIAENFVLSELQHHINPKFISYYSFRDKNKNQFEVDFCIENSNTKIVPIEVKFGNNKAISLNKLINDNWNDIDYGIILSSSNFSFDQKTKIKKIPIYAIGFLKYELSRLKD